MTLKEANEMLEFLELLYPLVKKFEVAFDEERIYRKLPKAKYCNYINGCKGCIFDYQHCEIENHRDVKIMISQVKRYIESLENS